MEKKILVTGSSRGIGAVLARRFAEKGNSVIINYFRSEKEALELRDSIDREAGSGKVLACKADVSDRAQVKNMFDLINRRMGNIDVLVNNAGINIDRPFLEMKQDEWTSVIDVILTGTFNCSQEFGLRYKGESGHIINIGALTAIRGRKNGANYCSARAGVVNLTRCLAQELAPRIMVNTVTPGFINTEEVMERYNLHDPANLAKALEPVPMKKMGTPDDIFRMIDFLVNESSYVTGQNFLVDGGYLMH